ncbi:hypothetical protein CR513_31886, partial [Mucuna pruriens]
MQATLLFPLCGVVWLVWQGLFGWFGKGYLVRVGVLETLLFGACRRLGYLWCMIGGGSGPESARDGGSGSGNGSDTRSRTNVAWNHCVSIDENAKIHICIMFQQLMGDVASRLQQNLIKSMAELDEVGNRKGQKQETNTSAKLFKQRGVALKLLSIPFSRRVKGRMYRGVFPLIKILSILDSNEKPTMGFIYEEMDSAKEKIQSLFNGVTTILFGKSLIKDRTTNCIGLCKLHAIILTPHFAL